MEIAEGREIPLSEARMAINGDDIGARSNQNLYEVWRRLTDAAGLKESVGKTYFTKSFIDMNSTSFERTKKPFKITISNGETRYTHLKQTKYVNMGLLLGFKRSEGKVGLNDIRDPLSDLGTRCKEMLRLAPKHLHEVIMPIFINHHKEIMKKSRLPWYIPQWLGGIGLPTGKWGDNSELDLRLAHSIILNWKEKRPIPINQLETTWKTWQVASNRLPKPVYCRTKNSSTEQYTKTVAKECINMLFDSNLRLQDIYTKPKESKAIERNARLWKPKAGTLPQPLDPERLKFQAWYPNWDINEEIDSKDLIKTTEGVILDLD
jgi:hypothetical protein